MPKTTAKTNKSAQKRFKITAKGKIVRSRAGKRHLLSNKTGKRKRQLRQPATETGTIAKKYIKAMTI